MKYFVGEKEYKTIQGAKKEADKTGQDVLDEAGVKVYPERMDNIPYDAMGDYSDIKETLYNNEADQDPEEVQEEAPVEVSEAVIGVDLSPYEEVVHGKVRRVFNGILRLRREPSPDDSAVCGVTSFEEKTAVKKAVHGGHTYYQTSDGYWVSGDEAHTEFIPE